MKDVPSHEIKIHYGMQITLQYSLGHMDSRRPKCLRFVCTLSTVSHTALRNIMTYRTKGLLKILNFFYFSVKNAFDRGLFTLGVFIDLT